MDRPDQLGPLKDAGRHVPAEDEAELFLVQPLALDVVDLELYVGGHKGGHVGAEVVPDNLEKAVSSVFAWEARSTLEGPLSGGLLTAALGNSSPIMIDPGCCQHFS